MIDIKSHSIEELNTVAEDIRQKILDTVSKNGGHLSSTMGATDLIVAMHRVFDVEKDPFIFDVSHQAYAHKLLTGRKSRFASLRQYGGLSGFTCRSESQHDPFGAGHASTSVSAALGMAIARDLSGDDYHVIAVIGDGAITAGMAFEALNQAGHLGSKLIVVLNDNGMSISPTVGALARLLSSVRFDQHYREAKKKSKQIITALPLGENLWQASQQVKDKFKELVMPTGIWEKLGFTYIGPIDGHNIHDLETALTQLKSSMRKVEILESVKENLSKFVPVTVSRMIEKSPTNAIPESKRQDLSILFVDIEGYTNPD